MTAIETMGLTKRYGGERRSIRRGARSSGVLALENLSISVQEGEIFGFLGPNGAGKSTLIRLLLGYLHPTAGAAGVLGLDIVRDSVEIRRRIGYLPGGIALYDTMTGESLLDYLGALTGREPIRRADLCERLEMSRGHPRPPRPRLLARDAPEDRDHPGTPARSRAGDPRRADRGPRPADAACVLRRSSTISRKPVGRSSSRRTSCPRSNGSAIVSRSSAAAGSSRSRTSRRCWRGANAMSRCESPVRRPFSMAFRASRAWWSADGRIVCQLEGDVGPFLAAIRDCRVVDLTIEPAHLEEAFLELYHDAEEVPA